MSLFWMEFYKLMHKRLIFYGGFAIMLFLGLFAFSNFQGEETVVNGERYKGIFRRLYHWLVKGRIQGAYINKSNWQIRVGEI